MGRHLVPYIVLFLCFHFCTGYGQQLDFSLSIVKKLSYGDGKLPPNERITKTNIIKPD